MITVDMRELPSGVYEFRCKVIDNYIKDTTCAFNCNVEGGTAAQVELCKDKCRVKAEAISTVRATIKTIEEAPVWNGASIRIKGGECLHLFSEIFVISWKLNILDAFK